MKANGTELSMNEMEQANGGWELWDTIMIKFAPIARGVQVLFGPKPKAKDDEKKPVNGSVRKLKRKRWVK